MLSCTILTVLNLCNLPVTGQRTEGFLAADTAVGRAHELQRIGSADTVLTDSIVVSDTVVVDSAKPKPMFTEVIHYTAKDTMRISLDTKKVVFRGDSKITYSKTELEAEEIRLDMNSKEAFAIGQPDSSGKVVGSPVFKDGGQQFDSKELKYNFETGKGFVKNIITQEGEGYVQGKLTKKMSDSIYCIKDGWYTTCDHHDHPHFYIRMSKAKMIKDKKVIVGFSNLVLEDVPLPLFIPFGFFPITKTGTSGVIMPTYGEERLRGFNLKNGGYYWMINDYVDISVLGDIYSNGSWGTNLVSNYRKRYRFSGNFSFSISKNHTGEKAIPGNYRETQDWAIRWTHNQDAKANPYSTFSASMDMSSSTNNYYNSNNINDIANQRKQSSISWSKKWPDKPFSLSTAFSHNQNTRDSSITIAFPNASFKMSTIYPFRKKDKSTNLKWYDNIGVSYSAELKNSITTPEKQLMKTPLSKWKNGFKHSIPVTPNISLGGSFSFNPSFRYEGAAYLSSIKREWVDTSATSGYVRTDTIDGLQYAHNYFMSAGFGYNPTIYGMYSFKPTSRIVAIRHVIRPSISFTYTPKLGISNDKYRKEYTNNSGRTVSYNIFEGQPYTVAQSPEKHSGSISLSLTNNLEMKVKNDRDTSSNAEEFKKIKLLESFSMSTSYDVFKDSLNWSTISLSARTSFFNNKLNINLSGTLDPYLMNADMVRVNKYSGGFGRLTNLSMSTGMSFSSDKGTKKEEKNDLVGGYYDQYMDFDVPWSFSFDYSLNLSATYSRNTAEGARKALAKHTLSQNLRVNGDFSLTAKWKFGFSSGYDFDKMEVTATSFNISRDLHCWDMTFSCIPFGNHQSYNFQINVRSSLLQDLKLTKRSSFYDNLW
ncbi:MAG: LPS-assembly protein LptD [Culturomica sp.]|jgi:lipopolysaccharide assembly outer membrane protein LptD (OstA)|nr:LPS-assembly protein LptD [Culturomica sp.]